MKRAGELLGSAQMLRPRAALALVVLSVCSFAAPAWADPIQLSIQTPDFLIPLDGQTGTLNVFADGSTTGSGFDALGTQSFTLGANSTSSGTLYLNLYFSGFPLGDPDYEVDSAYLQFTVDDFDFLTDQVTQTVTLKEMAILRKINGEALTSPINLADYLPPGTSDTDDELITLDPIPLMPLLSASDFTDPFILSLKLTAIAKNYSSSSVKLVNTPESILTDVNMTVTATSVPEPSTVMLLGVGLLGVFSRRRMRGVPPASLK